MQQFNELFEVRISAARAQPYLVAARDSRDDALRIYEWNLAVSSEFFRQLAIIEVVLRNAISREFEKFHRPYDQLGHWLQDPKILPFERQREAVSDAITRVAVRRHAPTLERLIPELGFGFWRYLLTKRYADVYWMPVLRHAFPQVANIERRALFDRVGRLHRLRNRIAHHEPIFGRRLDLDHRDCLLVLGAVCPATAQWAEGISRIPEVLANTPLLR